jgi:hypothetical protein
MKTFKDTQGKWLTQALFLEMGYKPQAIFTLDDEDKEYKGRVYPSLKRLYLEAEDPTEYMISQHVGGWNHWKRIRGNKLLAKHINEWQDELNVKLTAKGVALAIKIATDGGTFQAAKWLADTGWDKRIAGRPSKEDVESELKKQARDSDDFGEDILRVVKLVK